MSVEAFERFVEEQEEDRDIDLDSRVNRDDLNDDFAIHANKFAWYASACALATDLEADAKDAKDRAFATIYLAYRDEFIETGAKFTEKSLEHSVKTHEEYIRFQKEHASAKKATSLLYAAVESMKHKKDMLIQLGANYRAEGGSSLSMNEKESRVREQLRKNKGE